MKNTEKWIINTATLTAWNFTTSEEEAAAIMQRAIEHEAEWAERCESIAANRPEEADYWHRQAAQHRAAKFEIMTYEEFQRRQREKLLAGSPIEITAEEYQHSLEILPPEKWVTVDGVSEFCMCEHLTATYTTQCAHDLKTDKYYCKTVDSIDPTTWIHNFIRKEIPQ